MTKDEFWPALEFRVCRELAGLRDNPMRFWWCDGFIARSSGEDGEIQGDVWMCVGKLQHKWHFRLKLPAGSKPTTDDWNLMLPAENVTLWLYVDEVNQQIVIDPAKASLDRE